MSSGEPALTLVRAVDFTCKTSFLGVQERPEGSFPTWRVELMDADSQPTDIWSECWHSEQGWTVDYLRIGALSLTDALCVCFRGLLDYVDVEK